MDTNKASHGIKGDSVEKAANGIENGDIKKVLDKAKKIIKEVIKIGPCDLKRELKQRIGDLEEAQSKYETDEEGKS